MEKYESKQQQILKPASRIFPFISRFDMLTPALEGKVDEADWVTTDTGKVLKTLGKINSHYALTTYGVNAQPYYVLQGNAGTPMVAPRGYDLDVQGFIDFLQSGVEAYKAGK